MITKKEPDVIKNCLIRVRVTEEEHEHFMKRAHELGYRTVSDFIRTLIDDETEENEESDDRNAS
ncbi:plasmid mobilization protein [Ruminococcus sp.]